MLDWDKLRAQTPEDRQRAEVERRERSYAEDDQARDAGSKKALSITLVHEPETRNMMNGERVVMLRGTEPGRINPILALYVVPPRVANDEKRDEAFDRSLRELGGGDKVSLAGQWSKRTWSDHAGDKHESWEFKTQHFAQGEMSLERILEKARVNRGEQSAPAHEVVGDRGFRLSPMDVNRNNGGMGV